MSLRQGVTATEETKLKALISKGMTWEQIVARCQTADERGREQEPLLADVDLTNIKKNIFDPLVKKLEEAKKAGHKDITTHERAEAAKKVAAKKATQDKEE